MSYAQTETRLHDDSGELICPQCESGSLIRRQCRTVCEACGYVESCEDNFVPTQETPMRERLPDDHA